MVFVHHHKSAKIVLSSADFVFEPEVALELDGEEGPITHEGGDIGKGFEVVCEPALGIAFKEGTCKHDFGNVSLIEIGSGSKTNLILADPAPKAFAISSIESAGVLCLWVSRWIGSCSGRTLSKCIGDGIAENLAYERHCSLSDSVERLIICIRRIESIGVGSGGVAGSSAGSSAGSLAGSIVRSVAVGAALGFARVPTMIC